MFLKKLFYLCCIGLLSGCTPKKDIQKPNIIFFLADDLGYGELGILGQQVIETPNIDALAQAGMLFTNHYAGSPVCAPSRCVLLTGKHTGHAHIRGNDEWRERGEVWDYAKASQDPKLEGQRPLPEGTLTIGRILQDAGYKTGIIGKWGLGAPHTAGIPNNQGFDYFYGYNCQRQAHNLYPPHLWENNQKISLANDLVVPGTQLDSLADPNLSTSYRKYEQQDYAPQLMQEKAIDFISNQDDKPFFLYYASPLPHLPLQVPSKELDQYKSKIGTETPYIGDNGYFPAQYPRASYAAMISYIDQQIGALIETLKATEQYENTIICFSSDNGPTYLGGVDFDFFNSSAPFTNGFGRTKGFVYEGGIRVPLIVSWPEKINPNSRSNHISAFYDVLPTICDLANIPIPEDTDGISFAPSLLGQKQTEHSYLYWEFPSYQGQQAVRLGNWKGIRKDIFKGNMKIELYDLSKDLHEQENLAAKYPEIVAQIEGIMETAHTPAEIQRFKMKELGDQ